MKMPAPIKWIFEAARQSFNAPATNGWPKQQTEQPAPRPGFENLHAFLTGENERPSSHTNQPRRPQL